MSLLFNMLSRLVIGFLPRSKRLFISWLQLPSAVILEPPKIKSLSVSIVSPSICHEVMGPVAMILVFWKLSFNPTFLLSFTFIKRFFSSSLLSALRVVSSAYLRLLIFLLAILISACASSSLAFHMMYSAAAAAVKLLQRPHRQQPIRFPHPWDSPGKNTGVGCYFLLQCMKVKSESEVAQLCLTLSDPIDCSPSGSSIYGIFQARVLESGAIAFSDDVLGI